jgi:hypothetical protein
MLRVVERNYFWSKEKGRGLEKREYIGYVIDNRYYSNELSNDVRADPQNVTI